MASFDFIDYEYNYKKLSHRYSTPYVNFNIMCEHIEQLVDPELQAFVNRFSLSISHKENTAKLRYTLRGIKDIQPSVTGFIVVEDYHFKKQEHIIIETVTQIEKTARNLINGCNET